MIVTPQPITGAFSVPYFSVSSDTLLVPEPTEGQFTSGNVGEEYMASKTITFTLEVTAPPNWFFEITPVAGKVVQGINAVFTVTATAQGGYTGSLSLSLAGLPAGVIPVFSSNPISHNGTTTLTIPTTSIPFGPLVTLSLTANATP